MMDPQLRRFVRDEIARQLKVITSGTAGSNTMTTQTIENLLPGMPAIPARPIMHPFGFASRAPLGTLSVTAQQGEHPGNKLTLGHRDANAPSVDLGESVQYSVGGFRVIVKNGEVYVGKGADLEHVVAGETLKALLIALIEEIKIHTHLVTSPGSASGPPLDAAQFTAMQTQYLDNDKILVKTGGRY